MRLFVSFNLLLPFLLFCASYKSFGQESEPTLLKRIFSHHIHDSFTIHIKFPKEYKSESNRRFTTLYVLDADIYFDILSAIVDKYKAIGIMPPLILVGIGYGTFEKMEKLRTRDYLYPKAASKDKIANSGGGYSFLQFVEKELIPQLDSTYRTKPENRILMGHSFGGYFTLFAMLQNLKEQKNVFRSYIAASPSLQYSNQYLLRELQQTTTDFSIPKLIYTSVGELEDAEDGKQKQPISSMFKAFINEIAKKSKNIIFRGDTYSNFNHMETAIACFTKGLLFIYRDNP